MDVLILVALTTLFVLHFLQKGKMPLFVKRVENICKRGSPSVLIILQLCSRILAN